MLRTYRKGINGMTEQVCSTCSGAGTVFRQVHDPNMPGGTGWEMRTCHSCGGSGRISGGVR